MSLCFSSLNHIDVTFFGLLVTCHLLIVFEIMLTKQFGFSSFHIFCSGIIHFSSVAFTSVFTFPSIWVVS